MKNFFKKVAEKLNRGRVQAQGIAHGKEVEKSTKWATNNDVTKNDGYKFVDDTKEKLNPSEARLREKQFNQAKTYIKETKGIEVVNKPITKKFDVPDTDHERVEIEVKKGKAFFK